jgi:serine peptidase DegS
MMSHSLKKLLPLTAGLLTGFALAYGTISLDAEKRNAIIDLTTHPERFISFADAVSKASASVVKVISSDTQIKQSSPNNSSPTHLGSGVIIHPLGLIVTNDHVVKQASTIHIELADGRLFDAQILGADSEADVAVLNVAAGGLPAITGATEKVRVGDIVLAIGNPYAVGQTVTQGIVSGLGRDNLGLSHYENFIQTDAAINPGNSGGALINAHGDLVGINTANYSEDRGSQGIGFAIPVAMVSKIVNDLLERGHVLRGYLGVTARPANPAEKAFYKLGNQQTALIVIDAGINTPAANAGVRTGDIILKINERAISGEKAAFNLVGLSRPGDIIHLEVARGTKQITLPVTLGTRPAAN